MKKVVSYNNIFSVEEKEQIIKDYVENYLSLRELCEKYNINSKTFLRKLIGKKIRTTSEANEIAHRKYPDRYKQTEESKSKIREARLKWMKEHPEQTAWRQKNMSYPEKCFKKILEDNGFDTKYLIIREYSVFPYFVDFAFVYEKLAVEIDGSQHLKKDRKKKDDEKDKLLISKGWRVLRIAAIEVIRDGTKALKAVKEQLGDVYIEHSRVGILKEPKTYQKVIRGEDGLTDKQREQALNCRKVKERPTKEELWKMVKELPFETIGKKYGITGNSVKKWCKDYGLLYRKKDIDQLTGKEHKYSKELRTCLQCGKEYYAHTHSRKFCCNNCYKEYIKKNGLVNKENRKKSFNWIYKLNDDGSFTNKRVGDDEIEDYMLKGWGRGNKIDL